MLCDRTTVLTDEAKLGYRICTIRALVEFCKVEEIPRRKRMPPSRDWGLVNPETSEAEPLKPQSPPQSCLNTQCIFCLGSPELPLEIRVFCFCRPRKAREHVERMHLRFLKADEPLPCPLCGEVITESDTIFVSYFVSGPS
jgi:hypothetical protein